jgi:transcriptional regulator with XRE-family HTH domain
MPDPLDTFAENLRRLREERGLSQERLAHIADLNTTHVAKIERIEREPGVRTVAKLAKALGSRPPSCSTALAHSAHGSRNATSALPRVSAALRRSRWMYVRPVQPTAASSSSVPTVLNWPSAAAPS